MPRIRPIGLSEEYEYSPKERVNKSPFVKGWEGGPGRPKGLKNTNTLILEEAARVARENPGEMPVDYMLRVMRSPDVDDERRDNMAIAAAPFLHPRLAAIKVEQPAQVTVDMNPDQLYAQLVEILVLSGAINPKLLSKPAVQQGIAPQVIEAEVVDSEV